MDAESAIAYRKELLGRARSCEKLSREETAWLRTNPAYSERFGYPAMSFDVLSLPIGVRQSVIVRFEGGSSNCKLTPVFQVPLGKGYIICHDYARDVRGNDYAGKKIKAFFTESSLELPECNFLYRSALGLLTVSYSCRTPDYSGLHYNRSSIAHQTLAMRKTEIDEHTVRYDCTDVLSEYFGKYSFSVSWRAAEHI